MITADTITDEQIRELARSPGLNLQERVACDVALRIPANKITTAQRNSARARCAEILNARAVKS